MKKSKTILNFTNNQNEFKKSDVISNRALLALEDIAKGQGIDISNVISQARETGVGAGRNHIRQSKYYFDGTTKLQLKMIPTSKPKPLCLPRKNTIQERLNCMKK